MIDWESVEDTSRYGNDKEPEEAKYRTCPDCNGRKCYWDEDNEDEVFIDCEYCNGKGKIKVW